MSISIFFLKTIAIEINQNRDAHIYFKHKKIASLVKQSYLMSNGYDNNNTYVNKYIR